MRAVPLAILTLLLTLPAAAADIVDTSHYNPMFYANPPATDAVDLFGGPDMSDINSAIEGDPLTIGGQTRTAEIGDDVRYLRTTYTRDGSFTGTFAQTAPDGTLLDSTSTLSLDGGLRIARTVLATPGTLSLEESGAASGTSGLGVITYTDVPATPYLEATIDGTYTSLDPSKYTRIRFHVPQGTDEVDIELRLTGTTGASITIYDARGTAVAGLPATNGEGGLGTTVPATGGLWTLTLKGPVTGTFHAAVGASGTLE